ncbi:MAG: RsmB/NOP family class I SAM-dependent RNA methyltransferase [Kiloniellales bacterium]
MSKDRKPGNPRTVALRLLDAVLQRQRPLDEALAGDPSFARLSPRDRAFARNLVTTTLRRLGQIDAIVEACLDRSLKPKATVLRDLLRLGVCQIAVLRTPAHAAVSTSVALAQGPRLAGYRGLVNAVLRRAAREAEALLAQQDAARLNTPDWLWQSWSAAYGEATARAIATAQLQEPPLDLTVRADLETWAERLGACPLPTGSLRLPPGSGEIARLAGYEEGAWWVQDAAAALPARLLGDVAGQRVIDLCAAPGGKTAQLAAAGASVTAVERSPQRLKLLESNLKRLGLAAATVAADASEWRPPQPADAVLLDAPCSATGTLRRHPDIAWLKRAAQLPALTALQDRLLDNALAMLRPGGLLVYAVCSLQPEEGPQRIEALLARQPDGRRLERVPIMPDELGGLAELITPLGELRSLPCHLAAQGGLDGFYACRLRLL